MKSTIPLKIVLLAVISMIMAFSALCSGANLAPASVGYLTSSNYIPSQAGNFAYDGNLNTKWTSNPAPNQWLALNLGQSCNITSVVLRLASSCGTCDPATYNLKNYEIQTAASINGPWTSKGAFSNPTQAAVMFHSIVFTTQFIRLYVTNSGIDQHVRLPEFEVYGTYAPPTGLPSNLQVIAPTCTNSTA